MKASNSWIRAQRTFVRSMHIDWMVDWRCLLIACVLQLSFAPCSASAQGLVQADVEGLQARVQPGFQFERVVPESLVKWPVVVDWDRTGRLVVVESGGAARPIEEHNKQLLHRIVRLEDTDGDGIFDKRILAADKLPFTEGVLCLEDSILAAAPPYIWKLTDQDNDGLCEHREIWFDGQTITGCANDLHGPYLGNDGWIYWCKGAFAEQTHVLSDGSQLKDKAAHLFRRRLSGGPIECVTSGGMDNPVEIAFAPNGDFFFTSTFLQHPQAGKRDGIAHALYGSVFGKEHAALDGVVRTGELMPVMTHLGPAAPSGLQCLHPADRVSSQFFPSASSPTLIAAQFNLHRVSAHRLIPVGSGYRTQDQVLVESDRVDFHPTDVLEDGVGGLLVVDTGGWYDLCCPTSRIDQKIALGGIYRLSRSTPIETVQRTEVAADAEPTDAMQRLAQFHDLSPWIRRQAFLQIRHGGNSLIPEIAQALSSHTDASSPLPWLWALSYIGTDEALDVVHQYSARTLNSASEEAQQVACHILGLFRYTPARGLLEKLSSKSDIRVARAAVEALGRIGDSRSVPHILQVANRFGRDRGLEHSMVYALIEIGDSQVLRVALQNEQGPSKQSFLLLALDALHDEQLAADVLTALGEEDPQLAKAALRIAVKHPEWASQFSPHFERLTRTEKDALKRPAAQHMLATLVRAWQALPAVQDLVATHLSNSQLDLKQRFVLLNAWENLELPVRFDGVLSALFVDHTEAMVSELSRYRISVRRHPLLAKKIIGEIDENVVAGDFDNALTALRLLPGDSKYSNEALRDHLVQEQQWKLLARLENDASTAELLLQSVEELNVNALPDAIKIIQSVRADQLDIELLAQLSQLPAAKSLDADWLANLYRERTETLRQMAVDLDRELHAPPEGALQVIQEKLVSLPHGDPVRGFQVFRGSKANCGACHKVGYVGGEIGPELTRIGNTRTREALLEAILFPNARIEQGFRPLKVLTLDGQVLSGIAKFESGIVTLQTNATQRVAIPEEQIELQAPSETSIMPTGMLEQLSDQELADPLSFLSAAK